MMFGWFYDFIVTTLVMVQTRGFFRSLLEWCFCEETMVDYFAVFSRTCVFLFFCRVGPW